MVRRAIIFITCMVLLCGALSYAQMLESNKQVGPLSGPKPPKLDKIASKIKELNAKLKLSSEQKLQITDILNQYKVNIQKILDEAGAKLDELRIKTDADIEVVLTAEQRKDYRGVPQDEEEKSVIKIFK